MATEQEELKLVVTLVDNASAGLGKLQDQIKELGGGGGAGGNKHIEKLNEGTKALTETVSKMTGSFGEAFKSLGMLRLGFIGGVAGVAAFGYEMAKQIKDLGEYTDKIRNLGQLGKDIGVNPAMIKSIADQLAVYGVSLDQSTAATGRFAQRMAELQRDPRVRFNILGTLTAQTPQAQTAMREGLDALNKAVTVQDKLNIARQMYENIRQNALARHESPERAADEARQFMSALNYDPVLTRAGELKNLTDEEIKAWGVKQAAADHYSETLGKIAGDWERILDAMKESATSEKSLGTYLLDKFEKLTSFVAKAEESGGLQGIYKRALEKNLPWNAEPRDFLPDEGSDFKGRWPGANEQFGPLKPQMQSHRSGTDSNPLLQHVAFVSEEQKKGADANTEQLKRLNDLLSQAMGLNGSGGGAGGGGGGVMNAAFTTGGDGFPGNAGVGSRGTTPRFGNKDFPNFGDPGSAPNGSHVGAGSGGGAGETPAGPPAGGGGDTRLTGNAFLASQRARLKKEMDDNPELKRRFAAIIERENPTAGKQVAESAMNRAAMTGRSMASILGGGARSFYGPVRRGLIEPTMRSMSAKTLAARYAQIDAGLAGGNTVQGATDQGSAGDPNFVTGGHFIPDVNRERFNDWGGYRGVQYSRHWREAQQEQVAKARQSMDAEQAATTKVEGSGKIRVDVNAPKGTSVAAESSGLFKTIETYRQTQMVHADRGPSIWGNPP
jgi:hypothetical protein